MNPPASSASPPGTAASVATALISQRPPFIVSVLRLLMWGSGIITLLLGLSAYQELLPPKYAVWMGVTTGILGALQKAIIEIGDLLDDGIKNGSFPPKDGNPSVLRQWYLFPLLLGTLSLASCVTSKMTQGQLSLADIGYTAAQGAVIIAEASLAEKMADPKTPAWQVLASQIAFKQARKTLDREQAKLDAAFAALLAGKVSSDLAMPTYTSAKAAVPVLP